MPNSTIRFQSPGIELDTHTEIKKYAISIQIKKSGKQKSRSIKKGKVKYRIRIGAEQLDGSVDEFVPGSNVDHSD